MVYPLLGGLLTFPQVRMRLDEVHLGRRSGLFLIQLGAPGPAVFLKFPSLWDKAVGNADDFSLCDGLTRRGRVVNVLVQTRVEDFEWFVNIVGLLELPVVLCQVCCQYFCIVCVEVAEEGQSGGYRVASECALEGGEVCVSNGVRSRLRRAASTLRHLSYC